MVQQWAQEDPDATLAWVKTLPTGNSRNQAMQNLISAYANKDPQSAIALANTLPAGQMQNQAISSIASR